MSITRLSRSVLTLEYLPKLRLLAVISAVCLLLCGCARDDVGISFRDANHGALTQRIRLNSQLSGLSQATAELWIERLSAQTQQLGGKTQHPAEREWIMTVPFVNAADLVQKFEQFQQLVAQPNAVKSISHPVSNLSIQTSNLLIWQRHHLSYDLDLRGLGIVPNVKNTATVLISPQELLVIEFGLNTPWGARFPDDKLSPDNRPPAVYRKGRELRWLLKPGAANHLEAVFWLPSSVGIGGALIGGLVMIGMFLKAWVEAARSLPSSATVKS
ncbi:MAG: DUF3153 domain-containing protein [Pegethrix bostrychoides GSE-TBD4-15B]|jgi:hypothetical protein|uniref:DUF3153 domain-containing protein n=1 Tax=Pegethrix bostrychoides GSE-TBD4-15B TaxID=2839662 RepID=A0A951U6Q5_9CYAN|nr:DUF3153 domain-containing protein [Pegethrix bostrychoides GSE-TBD4-15B]